MVVRRKKCKSKGVIDEKPEDIHWGENEVDRLSVKRQEMTKRIWYWWGDVHEMKGRDGTIGERTREYAWKG